ncbi:Diguanylate cyclase with PAS/PAC sensor [Candidatus Terasakiella magnetica]|nr:Diguanylate cyclase with PAS/PAC sensor [Candidatus Terasakiella magnetica]
MGKDANLDGLCGNAAETALQIIGAIPLAMFAIDSEHRITHWNGACERMTGIPADQMLGSDQAWRAFYPSPRPVMADLILTGSPPETIERYYPGRHRPSALMEGAWEAEDYFPDIPNGEKWLIFTASPLLDKAGKVIGAVEILRDVSNLKTAEKSARESQHLLSEIVSACPVPIFVIDAEHRITHWNRACEAIMGASANQMIGSCEHWQPFYPAPRPVMADLVIDNATEIIAQYYSGKFRPSALIDGAWEATDHFPNFPSGPRWLYFTAAPLYGPEGQIIGAIETLQDISDQKIYEQMLERQARFDPLTGVANRMMLEERLSVAVSHAARDGRLLSVLFIDLDNFKPINDTLGHEAGDLLLKTIAHRLSEQIRAGDTLARVGGDEFVIILYAPDSAETVSQAAERIISTISQPVNLNGENVRVGCSLGIAMYPQDGIELPNLLRNADAAMYQAKAEGRDGYRFFKASTA